MTFSNPNVWKDVVWYITLSPLKCYHQCLGKIDRFFLLYQAPYIYEFLFISATHLSRIFLRVVKRSSIHRLQLGFVILFIDTIGLICFTTFNGMHLCSSVHYIVGLQFCLEWAANEPYFCPFLRRRWTSDKWPPIIFLNVWWVLPM